MSTCLASRLIFTSARIVITSLSASSLLILRLTCRHPGGLNLPMAERCCSIVFPIADLLSLLSCHLKSYVKEKKYFPPCVSCAAVMITQHLRALLGWAELSLAGQRGRQSFCTARCTAAPLYLDCHTLRHLILLSSALQYNVFHRPKNSFKCSSC